MLHAQIIRSGNVIHRMFTGAIMGNVSDVETSLDSHVTDPLSREGYLGMAAYISVLSMYIPYIVLHSEFSPMWVL